MSKNRKRINKSPIVVTRETDLTGTSNTPVRANGRGGGRFDGSIFIPTTPTGDGPTPTPIPTTTTSTTESEEITTTTTDNGETTTTTTDNGETTTTTTDNGETTTTTTDNGETTTTTTDNGETTTTTTDNGETTTTSTTEDVTTTTTTDNGETTTTTTEDVTTTTTTEDVTTTTTTEDETTTTTTEDVTTTTTTEDVTTTTTTEDVTTTTTTIDYESLSYRLVTMRQATIDGAGYVYRYTNKDLNGDFLYNDFEVKCIEETYPNGSNSSINIGNENNVDEYLSVGDSELVRFNYTGDEITGVYNSTARGVYSDTDLRLGATFDKYIINIIAGEIISIVSFDSIGDTSNCVSPTTTLPQLNEVEGSNRFELNNSDIQTEYQNITDLAYSFQEAKDQDVDIIQEVFDLVTYSHNQENEWDGYVDGDVVPMSVTNDTQKVYHYDELEIGSHYMMTHILKSLGLICYLYIVM